MAGRSTDGVVPLPKSFKNAIREMVALEPHRLLLLEASWKLRYISLVAANHPKLRRGHPREDVIYLRKGNIEQRWNPV